jgi:hypothetical protein
MFAPSVTVPLIGCAAVGSLYVSTSPQYSFHPLCTYGEIYRLRASVDIDGETYASEVVRQTSKSREWIYNLNSAGCGSTHGLALSFRLRDNRVVLLRATLCREGAEALNKARKIDVSRHCEAIHRPKRAGTSRYADGYIVDDAERPASWSRFTLGTPATEQNTLIRLTEVSAERVRSDPEDDLDSTAPGLLKASFASKEWFNSPDQVIPYLRRSAFYKENNRRFLYEVQER